jgi:SOS-response transcriptional repressor LexA
MTKKDRDQKALTFIYRYLRECHEYPSNNQVVEFFRIDDLSFDSNDWGGIRRRLFKNGVLKESRVFDFELSEHIIEELRKIDRLAESIDQPVIKAETTTQSDIKKSEELPIKSGSTKSKAKEQEKSETRTGNRRVKPVELPIYGEVRAGSVRGPEDLIVDISPSGDTLSIPDGDPDRDTFVLIVTGHSMISDHILEGDYVIVEKISRTEIKENDLIVTSYLKEEYNDKDIEIVNEGISNNDLVGHTLKHYHQVDEGEMVEINGKRARASHPMIRLSPRDRDPRYTIYTYYIDEDDIGRVTCIHREIRRL